MDIFQIDEKGMLFVGPDIDDWEPLRIKDIHVVFDLDDDLDIGIPQIPDQLLYIFFPLKTGSCRIWPNCMRMPSWARP